MTFKSIKKAIKIPIVPKIKLVVGLWQSAAETEPVKAVVRPAGHFVHD